MKRSRLSILGYGLALVVLVGAWSLVIQWNWHRVEALCGFELTSCEVEPNGSDAVDYQRSFRSFPGSIDALRRAGPEVIFVDTLKHPLYAPVSATLTAVASQVFGLAFPFTMYFVLALYASLGTLLLYQLLRTTVSSQPTALLLTGIATLSAAWVTSFSLPESYSLSVVMLMLSLRSGVALQRADPLTRRRALVRHLAVTGVASWAYLPIAGAVCFALGPARSLRAWRGFALSVAAVVAVSVIPQLWFGGIHQLHDELGYGLAWGRVSHLRQVATWIDVVSAMSVFSVVLPGPDYLSSSGHVEWRAVWSQPALLIGLPVVVCVYAWFIREALRTRVRQHELRGLVAWMGLLIVFHVFFNPDEVLLYTSIPLTIQIYLAARIVTAQADRQTRTAACGLALVLGAELLTWGAFAWRLARA